MGLSQSLYTGWSGMATHQRSLDNTGNNLSNINTTGYRKSDFMFSNLMSQLLTGAMGADGPRSTVNPKAVGLGVTTGAILNNFKQGSTDPTGNPLDVAMNGNGFFMVNTRSGTALTRNGSFYLDHTESANQRLLCVGEGLPVQGWMAVDGTVTPSQTVGNIYLPAYGDLLPGKATTNVSLKGILPTNTSSPDFNGRETSAIDLKGNLSSGTNTLSTYIYAAVTQTGGSSSVRNEVQKIPVEITYTGPTLSPDGTEEVYNWTMKTAAGWPNEGDPAVQIYPTSGGSQADSTVGFYTSGSTTQNHGAGQATNNLVKPGSADVKTVTRDAGGNEITTSFRIPSDFTMDVSRLTNLPDAPGGNELETWSVNGNPKGSMARTVTVYDEYTAFVSGTDSAGNPIMEAVRRVEERENTLAFTRTGQDNAGSDWSWSSSVDGDSGTLRFNTQGDLVSSTQSGSDIAYDFGEVRNINSEGSIQVSSQDGYKDGTLLEITIDQYGKIVGHYSNDVSEVLAQLSIGTVPNTSGLEGVSGTLFYPGSASGALMIGVAGDSEVYFGMTPIGAGLLSSGYLENSNVDLSQEFTSLISIERGYQLNAKTVTTSDEMLQTARDLKR